MSVPAKVVAAVSNSNTSSDKTRFGKAKSQALARQNLKHWQSLRLLHQMRFNLEKMRFAKLISTDGKFVSYRF